MLYASTFRKHSTIELLTLPLQALIPGFACMQTVKFTFYDTVFRIIDARTTLVQYREYPSARTAPRTSAHLRSKKHQKLSQARKPQPKSKISLRVPGTVPLLRAEPSPARLL